FRPASAAHGRARKAVGVPRFRRQTRSRSFTDKEYGIGARLDHCVSVLSKFGRNRVHWSRTQEGTPRTVTITREADGWQTGQTCSGCGDIVNKGLSDRWHACPDPGTSLHRDHTAARNMLWRPAASAVRGRAGLPAGVN